MGHDFSYLDTVVKIATPQPPMKRGAACIQNRTTTNIALAESQLNANAAVESATDLIMANAPTDPSQRVGAIDSLRGLVLFGGLAAPLTERP